MRIRRPQPGPQDPRKTPAPPGSGDARPEIDGEQAATGSVPSFTSKPHPSLIELVRLLGRQFARDATRKGGRDE